MSITFSLVIDDFGVKYVRKEHVGHLHRILAYHCEKSKNTGQVNYFLASPLIGIIRMAVLAFPCLDVPKMHYFNSSMIYHQQSKITHPRVPAQPIASKFK